MDRDSEIEIKEFYVDNLSECSDDGSESHDDDDKDTACWNQYSLSEVLYGDSDESDENEPGEEEAEEEEEDNVWSTNDEPVTLEPFGGSPGVKITPSSRSVADVVNLFVGADLFEHMATESNRYHYQVLSTCHRIPSSKAKKWRDVTTAEMRKFLGLIVLMGQVRKDMLHEYWSTDPTIETPFFSRVMSRNRFTQILQSWHFSNNEDTVGSTDRLVKVQPLVDYLRRRFNEVYKPGRQLSLDEYVIPWRGKSIVETACSDGRRTDKSRDGLMVRAVCDAATGYICNFVLRHATRRRDDDDDDDEKEESALMTTVMEPYRNLWHHVYHQDNRCKNNSVALARTLLREFKIRTCGTIRKSRDLPRCLRRPTLRLASGESVFRRNRDVLLLVWNNGARNTNMISTIHSAQLVKVEGASKKMSPRSPMKPALILDYNRYTKRVDRVSHHLEFCSILRRTKKWTTRVAMFLLNCALFNSFKVYAELNGRRKVFKRFLHDVAVAWITGDRETERTDDDTSSNAVDKRADMSASDARSDSMEERGMIAEEGLPDRTPTRRTPKMDHPDRLTNLRRHKLAKIVSSGKSKMPQRQCRVCASKRIRSRTCFVCAFCSVPLHKGDCYQRYHTLKKY